MKEKLLTLAVALLAATGAWAQNEFPFDGLYYMVTDETAMTVELINYNTSKPTGTLIIPTTVSDDYYDYTVTSIGDYALENCSSLTCVAIPASVTNIGNGAFRYCSALKKVIVWGLTPPSVKSSSFTGTHSDLAVYVPAENLEDYKAAEVWKDFNLQALHSHFTVDNMHYTVTDFIINTVEIDAYMGEPEGVITIPTIVSYEGTKYIVTSIGDDTFNSYSKITEVILPEGLTRIGIYAFNYCIALTEINIPNNVTIIDRNAFSNCTQLNKLRIGNNLETIGANAFDGCSALEEINIQATTPPTVASDAFTSVSRDIPVYVPQESLEDYKAADVWKEFTAIQVLDNQFVVDNFTYEIINLIGKEVKLVGFSSYTHTGLLNIPSAVTYKGTTYTITDIAENPFILCYKLTGFTVDEDHAILSAENGVLFNKDKTALLAYPIGKTETAYTIPGTVTRIANYALYGCHALSTVDLPDGLTRIGNYAFSITSITQVNIPKGVTVIENSAFESCNKLAKVCIPAGVTKIGNNAFYECSALTELTVLATTPPTLGTDAFFNVEFDIPVYVPAKSLNAYKTTKGWKEFTKLQAIVTEFTVGGLTYEVIDQTAKTVEVINFTDELPSTATIPATVSYESKNYTVTAIASEAFSQNKTITEITISEGITSIGDNTFGQCYALTTANIPASLTNMGDWVFDACTALTQINVASGNTAYCSENGILFNKDKTTLICYPAGKPETDYTIPSSVTIIEENAFSDCAAITTLTIPAGVTTIGSFAFYFCTALAEMTVLATVPPTVADADVFYSVSRDIPVYVPAESLTDYKAADGWKEFTKLQAINTSGLPAAVMPESIRMQGGMLHNPQGLHLTLYDMQGRQVYSGTAATVSQPAGVYVLRCNGASGKVLF